MTQQLTLLTFTALFIAFMFNACSDVAGPNENLDNEYSQLSSSETEMQDLRRRGARTTTAGESTAETIGDLSCTLQSIDLEYGGGSQGQGQRHKAGEITPSFSNGKLIILYSPDEDWTISETYFHVQINDGTFPDNFGDWDTPGYEGVYSPYKDEPFTREFDLNDFELNQSISVGAKAQMHYNGNDNNGQTATAGEEKAFGPHRYFNITIQCPADAVAFNGAG